MSKKILFFFYMLNTPNRQYNSTMKIKHRLVTSVLLQIFLIHIALHVMIFKSEQSYSYTAYLVYLLLYCLFDVFTIILPIWCIYYYTAYLVYLLLYCLFDVFTIILPKCLQVNSGQLEFFFPKCLLPD
jgi:hypothetical protein